MIRTLVSASSELARAGLVAIVRGDTRLVIAGATTPMMLSERVRSLEPDVVLEERETLAAALGMPSVALVDDPIAAWTNARDVRGVSNAIAILARDASPQEIVAAIVAVAAGLIAVQPRTLVGSFENDSSVVPRDIPQDGRDAPRAARLEPRERLTAREIDVLGELARGVPNKTIAARLGISEHTVKFHVASIFAKLAVTSRTEAVTQGVRLGLVML